MHEIHFHEALQLPKACFIHSTPWICKLLDISFQNLPGWSLNERSWLKGSKNTRVHVGSGWGMSTLLGREDGWVGAIILPQELRSFTRVEPRTIRMLRNSLALGWARPNMSGSHSMVGDTHPILPLKSARVWGMFKNTAWLCNFVYRIESHRPRSL